MKRVLMLSPLLLVFIAQISFSATYTVPTQYTTIQAAIDSATHGDEVVVQPGHYNERLLLKGRNLVLRSVDPASPEVVANTIIDASGSGAAIKASSGENRSCRVEGFTLTGGRYGVMCIYSGPTISFCKAQGNETGMSLFGNALISQCTMTGNSTGLKVGGDTKPPEVLSCKITVNTGLGVSTDGDYPCLLTDCLIGNNGSGGYDQGGILVYGRNSLGATHCVITGNKGYGVRVYWGGCGAISNSEVTHNSGSGVTVEGAIMLHTIVSASVNINNSTIVSNAGVGILYSGPTGGSITGCLIEKNAGGVYAKGTKDPSSIFSVVGYSSVGLGGCKILDNGRYGFHGGQYSKISASASVIEGGTEGLYVGAEGTVTNCLVTKNVTGISVPFGADVTISLCTVSGNKTGISANPGRNADVISSICYGNDTENSGSVSATWSCIGGSSYGTGNISDDPLFVDLDQGDFSLQPGSPCIDTGKGTATSDLLGFGRPVDIPGVGIDGGAAYDMGAYEVQPEIPYTPTPTLTLTSTPTPTLTLTPTATQTLTPTPTINPRSDINRDGVVSIEDLLILQREWGSNTEE